MGARGVCHGGSRQYQLNSVERGGRSPIELWIGGAAVVMLGLLCLLVLPRMKGAIVGFCWAAELVRQEPAV